MVRLEAESLERVGVNLLDPHQPALRCKTCGQIWVPDMGPDGRLPEGWWVCPTNPEHTTEAASDVEPLGED